MNILSTDCNTLLVVTAGQLKEFALELINEARSMTTARGDENFLTADEAMEKIGCGRATLSRWAKAGLLVPSKVGSKVRYKESDVLNFLEHGNNR